ncbi:MAG: hypothetical protein GY711_10725 [bacterium]|nr:hypothetical protein [bacterium]
MSDRDELATFESVLARIFLEPDTQAALEAAAADERLGADLRARLAAASPEGVRIAALLVVRLRFERVLNGSQLGGEWFERDPKDFAGAFKRYHAEVPPTAATPWEEAPLFEAWASSYVG